MLIYDAHLDHTQNGLYLDDARLNKLILEDAQMLSYAINLNGGIGPYKMTKKHLNHPFVKWVAESSANYEFLIEHFKGYLEVYAERFDRSVDYHGCYKQLSFFKKNLIVIEEGPLTPMPRCGYFKDDLNLNTKDMYRKYMLWKWHGDLIRYYNWLALGKPKGQRPRPPRWKRSEEAPVFVKEWCKEFSFQEHFLLDKVDLESYTVIDYVKWLKSL